MIVARKRFYRLRLEEPLPIEWAVVLGEAVHDLHSALEQCIYCLTVDWQRCELSHTSFPLYTDKNAFYARTGSGAWNRRSGMYRIRGIGPGPRQFVECVQPYPQRWRHFYCQDLRTIHDLWNQDKHRLVHLWGLRFDADVRFRPEDILTCQAQIDRRVLHDGQIVLKILSSAPRAHLNVKIGVNAAITIKSGQRRSGGGALSLWHTTITAADVIRKLANAIGHQDDPVNIDVWTVKASDLV